MADKGVDRLIMTGKEVAENLEIGNLNRARILSVPPFLYISRRALLDDFFYQFIFPFVFYVDIVLPESTLSPYGRTVLDTGPGHL